MRQPKKKEPTQRRPATMKDIANAAGVAQSTVSRILNDAPLLVPISRETRERLLAAAAEFAYRPNPHARGLRGAPTMLLGAIVRDITDPFFASARAVRRPIVDRPHPRHAATLRRRADDPELFTPST